WAVGGWVFEGRRAGLTRVAVGVARQVLVADPAVLHVGRIAVAAAEDRLVLRYFVGVAPQRVEQLTRGPVVEEAAAVVVDHPRRDGVAAHHVRLAAREGPARDPAAVLVDPEDGLGHVRGL